VVGVTHVDAIDAEWAGADVRDVELVHESDASCGENRYRRGRDAELYRYGLRRRGRDDATDHGEEPHT
jgi:hypothetical protein